MGEPRLHGLSPAVLAAGDSFVYWLCIELLLPSPRLSTRVDDEVMTEAIGIASAKTRGPLAVTLQAAFDDAEETDKNRNRTSRLAQSLI
ncbi:MAG: hypothetical protein EPN57_05125 [Paraburkholderia sp.]|nr:MAG: hypothetical protein EPN57_05125 [Paraburkholderia sp.]